MKNEFVIVRTMRCREYAKIVILSLAVALVSGCGVEADTSLIQPDSTSVISVDSSTVEATTVPAETATPTGPSTISNLGEFVTKYGYHQDCAEGTLLEIPKLGVYSQVCEQFVPIGTNMPDPYGPADVALYDLSQWSRLGGTPGSGENAIFAGHVDYNATVAYAGVRYRGPGVFQNLRFLTEGDLVKVHVDGEIYEYEVVWQRELDASADSWREMWSADVPVESITIYTCGGEFDAGTRTYSQRLVVRAERRDQS